MLTVLAFPLACLAEQQVVARQEPQPLLFSQFPSLPRLIAILYLLIKLNAYLISRLWQLGLPTHSST